MSDFKPTIYIPRLKKRKSSKAIMIRFKNIEIQSAFWDLAERSNLSASALGNQMIEHCLGLKETK